MEFNKFNKVIQSRIITSADIETIQNLMIQNPDWNRTKLSKELCRIWKWTTLNGHLKDMACRSLLRKLENLEMIKLPRRLSRNHFKVIDKSDKNSENELLLFKDFDINYDNKDISELLPLKIINSLNKSENILFRDLMKQYHYLGFKQHVGEHMKYIVYDNKNNPIACLLFGSSAWAIESRDKFIGWEKATRIKNLIYITNNMRFLILPWIKIPNLASHILSQISKRIVNDWIVKYHHPVYLLETFVECDRFYGTCYKAANWIYIGKTKGRSRNDIENKRNVPIKDIYLYPLVKNYKKLLNM